MCLNKLHSYFEELSSLISKEKATDLTPSGDFNLDLLSHTQLAFIDSLNGECHELNYNKHYAAPDWILFRPCSFPLLENFTK